MKKLLFIFILIIPSFVSAQDRNTMTPWDAFQEGILNTAGLNGFDYGGKDRRPSYMVRNNSVVLSFQGISDSVSILFRNVSTGIVPDAYANNVKLYSGWTNFHIATPISFSGFVYEDNVSPVNNTDFLIDSVAFFNSTEFVPDTVFIKFADQIKAIIVTWDSATYPDGWATKLYKYGEEWSVDWRSRFLNEDITDDGVITTTNRVEFEDDYDYAVYVVNVAALKLGKNENRILSPYTSKTFEIQEPDMPRAPDAPTGLKLETVIKVGEGERLIIESD